jgi:hypothetical protein
MTSRAMESRFGESYVRSPSGEIASGIKDIEDALDKLVSVRKNLKSAAAGFASSDEAVYAELMEADAQWDKFSNARPGGQTQSAIAGNCRGVETKIRRQLADRASALRAFKSALEHVSKCCNSALHSADALRDQLPSSKTEKEAHEAIDTLLIRMKAEMCGEPLVKKRKA